MKIGKQNFSAYTLSVAEGGTLEFVIKFMSEKRKSNSFSL